MAVGSIAAPPMDTENRAMVVPVSAVGGWVEVCEAPDANDNAGSTVVRPNAITREEQNWLGVAGHGTTLMIRLKYDDDVGTPTSPVVQPFGRSSSKSVGSDNKGHAHRLKDENNDHELTLTVDTTNDVTDGTFKYTDPVEVDMDGAYEVLVAVKTAFAAGSGTVDNSTIQAKVK